MSSAPASLHSSAQSSSDSLACATYELRGPIEIDGMGVVHQGTGASQTSLDAPADPDSDDDILFIPMPRGLSALPTVLDAVSEEHESRASSRLARSSIIFSGAAAQRQ